MSLDLSKNNREVTTECLKIHGNCLEFNDTVIQLSNISLFSTENIAPASFPVWTVWLILIGFVLLFLKMTILIVVGIFLIACGAYGCYHWNAKVQETKKMKRLLIATNSGNLFTIIFHDQLFLTQVIQVLTEIIATPQQTGDVIINVRDSTFSGHSSVVQNLTEAKPSGRPRYGGN